MAPKAKVDLALSLEDKVNDGDMLNSPERLVAPPGGQWLRVSGERIVTEAGAPVVLRGFGVGGWLNMENFITGYPATESLQREGRRSRSWRP